MSEPVHHTILLFDIERFGGRDDVEQTFLRRKLYDIVEDTLVSAGVEQTQQYREDRGDGLIALISSEISKAALLRTLLTTTPGLLHHYNRLAASSTQMRLRIVLASGEVAHDPREGVTGALSATTSTQHADCWTPQCCAGHCNNGPMNTPCCVCPTPCTKGSYGMDT